MPKLGWRILVAALGIPVLVVLAKGGAWPRAALVVVVQGLILREWIALNVANGARVPLFALSVAVAGLDALVFSSGSVPGVAACVGGIAIMLLLDVFRSRRRPLLDLGAAALFLIYVAIPLALWFVMDKPQAAAHFAPAGALISLWLATWLCDSAAYFTGVGLGKHKLYPAASPNKTVEGFAGGIIGAALAPLLLFALGWARPSLLDGIVLTAAVGLVGQAADLLESLMKREVQIKDTSSLLPGHGGLLDRFDSLLLSTPVFYAYLLIAGN